jgi:hypothetical protein
VLRLLALLIALAVAAVWVEPTWQARERTLVLRLRERAEILDALRDRARAAGERVVSVAGDDERTPQVGARKGASPKPAERLTREDRARLDRLVEEKLGER